MLIGSTLNATLLIRLSTPTFSAISNQKDPQTVNINIAM
jgi:hypothetical protein